jgi:hypothetical protein
MKKLAIAALVSLAMCAGTDACIHPPKGFTAYVDSGAQRGLVFFDNGREELVIQPSYTVSTIDMPASEFTDAGLLKNLTAFAWVVPLPSLPDSYAEADAKLFDDISAFTGIVSRIPEPERGPDESGPKIFDEEDAVVEFFAALKVGDYTIQPIKAKGEAGGKELAAWLEDNGFGELDQRVLRFYLAAEYYWLAIKLNAGAGLPAEASAKPLRISFKTPRPVYPFKIYDKRGSFDLELWLITRHAVDLTKSKAFGIETAEQLRDSDEQKNRETSYVRLPETVRAIADGTEELKELRTGKVYVYRFFGHELDSEEGVDLGLLQDELHFEFEKDVAAKPTTEVKPTPEEDKKEEKPEDK